jgi:restriction system protein
VAEINTPTQPTASADHGLWRDRLASEVANAFPLPSHPSALSKDLLDALEWRRFEELVTWYFQRTGFEAERSRVGADGGVDILLSKAGDVQPHAYVQCKAWHRYKVGIKPIRELFGVMASDEIPRGFFVTTGEFTEEAARFAQGKKMTLVDGSSLLADINALPESDRSAILQQVTAGDYTTPTCPQCDVKMVRRTGKGGEFWGCPNYSRRPSCRQTFKMREG